MNKYNDEFKREVINFYLNGLMGYTRVAAHFKITSPMIKRWVAAYSLHGEESFGRRPGHYDVEFKMSVLQHVWDNELSNNQAAAFFNIPNPTSIGIWDKRYRNGGVEALRRATKRTAPMPAPTTKPENQPDAASEELSREQLIERVKYLEMEVVVIKKLEALTQAKKALALKKQK